MTEDEFFAQANATLHVGNAIAKKAAESMRGLMRHRERYIRAWIAVTGIHPAECEWVEEVQPLADGVVRTVCYVRKRSGAMAAIK